MKGFIAFSLVYLLAAVGVAWASGASRELMAFGILVVFQDQLRILLAAVVPLALGLVVVGLTGGTDALRRRGPEAALALVGVAIFAAAFMTVKTHLQDIAGLFIDLPFFADPFFAALDRALHFGTDPYQFSHRLFSGVSEIGIAVSYVVLWVPVSLLFPVILAIIDGDRRRRGDYLRLYFPILRVRATGFQPVCFS